MKNGEKILGNTIIKPLRKRYILAAVLVVLLLIAALIFIWFEQEQSDSESEKIIRQVVAEKLNKNPNELSNLDFEKIEFLDLLGKKISDVRMLRKFKNLKTLGLSVSITHKSYMPKCLKFTRKLGIPDILSTSSFDLNSLGKLPNLQVLLLHGPEIKNIAPLAELTNIEFLYLLDTQVDSIKPLSNLTSLKDINICRDSMLADLEPVKQLKNLNRLNLDRCSKIQDNQIADLRKSLPNITLLYRSARQIDVKIVKVEMPY